MGRGSIRRLLRSRRRRCWGFFRIGCSRFGRRRLRLDDRSEFLAEFAQRKGRAAADGPGHEGTVVVAAAADRWDLEVSCVFGGGFARADAGDEGLQDAVTEAGVFGAWNEGVGFGGKGGGGCEFRIFGDDDDEGVLLGLGAGGTGRGRNFEADFEPLLTGFGHYDGTVGFRGRSGSGEIQLHEVARTLAGRFEAKLFITN